ncbi:unnamed protein product, partial [Closterium sp. NIES-53]
VKERTSNHGTYDAGSHVMLFGEKALGTDPVSDFLGDASLAPDAGANSEAAYNEDAYNKDAGMTPWVPFSLTALLGRGFGRGKGRGKGAFLSAGQRMFAAGKAVGVVGQRDAEVLHLWHKYKNAPEDSLRKQAAMAALSETFAHRRHVDQSVRATVAAAVGEGRVEAILEGKQAEGRAMVDDWMCLRGMCLITRGACGGGASGKAGGGEGAGGRLDVPARDSEWWGKAGGGEGAGGRLDVPARDGVCGGDAGGEAGGGEGSGGRLDVPKRDVSGEVDFRLSVGVLRQSTPFFGPPPHTLPLFLHFPPCAIQVRAYEASCGHITQYGMKHMRAFANLCNAAVAVHTVAAAAQEACPAAANAVPPGLLVAPGGGFSVSDVPGSGVVTGAMAWPIYLYLPNIVGYFRILANVWAFAIALSNPRLFVALYFFSFFCDYVDGRFATWFNQSESTHSSCNLCLPPFRASMPPVPPTAFLPRLVPALVLVYPSLLHQSRPATLPFTVFVPVPYLGPTGVIRALGLLCLPGWALKQITNVVQLKTAADACVEYDLEKTRKSSWGTRRRGHDVGSCKYQILTGPGAGTTCWRPDHSAQRYYCRLDDLYRELFGPESAPPIWPGPLPTASVGTCAFSVGACVVTSPAMTTAVASLSFTLDFGASQCFIRDHTIVTPLSAPVPVALADPTSGPAVARSSTTLPCPAVPSSFLTGLYIISTAICMESSVGAVLATFTREPHSGLFVLLTPPPQVAASSQVALSRPVAESGQVTASPLVAMSGQVVVSGLVAASCSCRSLAHPTVLWHHRLGHPSLPHLRIMASHSLVLGLLRVFSLLPPSLTPPCTPCDAGRPRATSHSSSLRPATAPF